MRRRVHQTLELDQSLRQSRSIWVSLAVLLVPAALLGILVFIEGVAGLTYNPLNALWNMAWGCILVLADVAAFNRVYEATRRLRALHENPDANVHPLPAPFQASLFGPYH